MAPRCSAYVAAVVGVLAACAALAACGAPVDLLVVVKPDFKDPAHPGEGRFETASLSTLHLIVDNHAGTPLEKDVPINDENFEPVTNDAPVDKTKPVSIEVWGCANPDACTVHADVSFRGCTPGDVDLSQASGDTPETVLIVPLNDPFDRLAGCAPF